MADNVLSLEHIIRNIAEGKFTPSDEPKVNLSHAVRNVHESIGIIGTDKYQGTQFRTAKTVAPVIKPGHNEKAETASNARNVAKNDRSLTAHNKVSESAPSDMSGVTISNYTAESGKKKVVKETPAPNYGDAATVAQWPAAESGKKKVKECFGTMGGQGNEVGSYGRNTESGKKKIKEAAEPEGTIERRKVKFVARPDDADPKSSKSTLGRLGQIKTKIIDEEKVIPGKTPVIIDPYLKQISPDGDKLAGNRPQRDRLKTIVKEAIKEDAATSIATKAAGGLGKKLIPGVGAAYGVADAISRAKSGDYVGAGLAGASGVASLVPGVGTAVSAGLDAANLYRDYKSGAFSDTKDEPKAAEPAKPSEPVKPTTTVSTNVNKPKPIKQTKPFKGFKK
jgi:hypothetical protein